jgi:predicted nucleotidyltransferase
VTHAELDLSACPRLAASREYSGARIRQACDALAASAPDLEAVATIAVCGSLGRLEAHPSSDVDCIIVVKEAGGTDRSGTPAAVVTRALEALELKASKPWGIYAKPVARTALLATAALGSVEEPAAVFGKRMQLLLDARPLMHEKTLARLQAEVVDWYRTGYLDANPGGSWTYLINDVMRYLHAYAAWQQYKIERTADDSWQLRQAKFRGTRLVTLAGLLVLLGESNRDPGKRDWLLEHLVYSPLERLALVMNKYDRGAFEELLEAYEIIHRLTSDPLVRDELLTTGPDSIAALGREPERIYRQIHDVSAGIIGVLTRFVLARQADWDPRFFERLIF